MKGVKGRILKKLKSIPHVGYLKQGQQPLHHGFPDPSPPPDSGRILGEMPVFLENNQVDNLVVSEVTRGIDGEEDQGGPREPTGDKENIRPPPPSPAIKVSAPRKRNNPNCSPVAFSELDRPSFRRPDLNSDTLFDPNLLAEFHRAVMDHMRIYQQAMSNSRATREDVQEEEEEELHREDCPPSKLPRTEEDQPLIGFEERCPPAGSTSVILYTTTLRGIRKTFEDCNSVRFLLESLKVVYYERDVSMHMEFRDELWRALGGRAIPPKLFIRGRYIGGADEALGLHEQGKLLPLMKGLLHEHHLSVVCEECGGMRFLVCLECNGSRKIYGDEIVQCPQCNENGLILCPLCC